jgi:hypothetical protein
LTRTPMNLSRLNLSRTPQTRLQLSQYLPNKQTDKRKKGLRAPKETVNEGTSLTHLLNRPAITPIVRGWKLACFQFDLPARTRPASARMRRFFCRLKLMQLCGCGSLAPVPVLRSSWTAPFTML